MEKEANKPSSAPAFAKASADKKATAVPSEVPKGRRTEDKEKLNVEELKRQLEDCQKLKDEYLSYWQRERADFLNYKKEELERIEEILKYANISLILKILPILDNFDVIEKKLPENFKKDENFKGILQIKIQLKDFLKSQGVEQIESLGKKFDPRLHEVVEETKVEGRESNVVIEEIQKGYTINGRLLKPAKVRVTK